MARLIDRQAHLASLAAMFADRAAIAAATADIDPTVQLSDWLKRLEELHGLPYRYLVANDRFLPNEAIRFFQIDFNWLHALVEGACSIGHASDAEAAQHAVTRLKLHAAARRGVSANDGPIAVTGFLLRSQVVPGWPKLEVVPYDKAGAELIDMVRMDLLSPSILLYMVVGTIDHVVIREPAIGLHSGIDIDGGKPLRYVTVSVTAPAGTKPGDQLDGVSASVDYRAGNRRVLRINALADRIENLLDQNKANNGPNGEALPFTAAEFALEMIEGTQEVTFRSEPAPGK
jgi:hypothetical protein